MKNEKIYVCYMWVKNGIAHYDMKGFNTCEKALKFCFMMYQKGYIIYDIQSYDEYKRNYCLNRFDITSQKID